MNVLIVDDDDTLRALLCEICEAEGMTVSTALDGRAALSKLAADGLPDLIVLDLMMPGMDGAQFLAKLRERVSASCPVLVFTAASAVSDVTKEVEAHLGSAATHLLRKPVPLEVLINKLRAVAAKDGSQ